MKAISRLSGDHTGSIDGSASIVSRVSIPIRVRGSCSKNEHEYDDHRETKMNISDFDPKKTALLFFDILNGYIAEPEPGKPRAL